MQLFSIYTYMQTLQILLSYFFYMFVYPSYINKKCFYKERFGRNQERIRKPHLDSMMKESK